MLPQACNYYFLRKEQIPFIFCPFHICGFNVGRSSKISCTRMDLIWTVRRFCHSTSYCSHIFEQFHLRSSFFFVIFKNWKFNKCNVQTLSVHQVDCYLQQKLFGRKKTEEEDERNKTTWQFSLFESVKMVIEHSNGQIIINNSVVTLLK